jgi:hypothetical protein
MRGGSFARASIKSRGEDDMAWDPDHIDFISEYCDRWCERCALTSKCAAFTRQDDPGEIDSCSRAVEQAMEALRVELAMPAPPARPWVTDILNVPPLSEEELKEIARIEEGRSRRAEEHPALVIAREYAIDAYTWLQLYANATRKKADAARRGTRDSPEAAALRIEIDSVFDALEVVAWDKTLISSKLYRALRMMEDDSAPLGDNPLQTDSNGSAKIVLLLTERSETGWRLIARWAPESEIARKMADTLAALRADIEGAFPNARRFIRPGFDEVVS